MVGQCSVDDKSIEVIKKFDTKNVDKSKPYPYKIIIDDGVKFLVIRSDDLLAMNTASLRMSAAKTLADAGIPSDSIDQWRAPYRVLAKTGDPLLVTNNAGTVTGQLSYDHKKDKVIAEVRFEIFDKDVF